MQEVEDDEKEDGFWSTLFLLKPDTIALREILDNTDAEFLIHLQVSRDHLSLLESFAIDVNTY